jgi:hypothetical protein
VEVGALLLRLPSLKIARTSGVPRKVSVDELAARAWSWQRADVGILPTDPMDRVRYGRVVDVRSATGDAETAFGYRSKMALKNWNSGGS